MDKPRHSGQTKENILKAAQEEFVQKGYDGTRMEDIALKAGVTKMMLYYHFNNKENILKELLQNIFKDAKHVMLSELAISMNYKKIDPELFKTHLKQLIEPNIKTISFIVKEFIKDSFDHGFAFNILKGFYDQILEILKTKGAKIKNQEQYYIRMFFFQSVPLLIYFIFKEHFLTVFNYDPEMTDRVFFKKFMDTLFDTIIKPPLK
jgi:AcrR family transcriptional regulator